MWHRTFGHQNTEYKNLIKLNNVTGLIIAEDELEFCETCKLVKNKKQPAITKEDIKARHFGPVISIAIDVIPCESLEGYRYRLNVIDRASSLLCTFDLESKGVASSHREHLIK